MTSTRAISPLGGGFDVELDLPGSKSITNRYLLLAALASGTTTLRRVLVADDVDAMLDCVRALGAEVVMSADATVASVVGTAGNLAVSGSVNARQSGTTARFIAPVLALSAGPWELDGAAQLRARPMADLFIALERLGAHVVASGAEMSLPVLIKGPIASRRASVAGSVSSQFLSGLLLAAPLVDEGLEIEVDGALVSRPYVDMTVAAMRRFGASVIDNDTRFVVAGTGYRAQDLDIEPDASSASYFFGAAAALGGTVRVSGLGRSSLQGDLGFVDVLESMGATVSRGEDFTEVSGHGELRGVDVDLSGLSDTVPTLAVVAALANGPTRITGVGFIRNKESDRIGGVVNELRRCGVDATEESDGLVIRPGGAHGAVIRTYDDHRMAMAFSILGLAVDGVVIEDPSCVDKTFPSFFEVLDELSH